MKAETPTVAPIVTGSRRITLLGGTPLSLRCSDEVFIIRRGAVDVFSVAAGDTRRHVLRLEMGQALFGVSDAQCGYRGLVAIAAPDADVDVHSGEDWQRIVTAEMLEQWIHTMARRVFGPSPAWADAVSVANSYALAVNQKIYAAVDVVWLLLSEGSGVLAADVLAKDAAPTNAGDVAPVVAGLGFVARAPFAIHTCDTAAVLSARRARAGLATFHRAVLLGLDVEAEAAAEEGAQRFAARIRTTRTMVSHAIDRLAEVIRPQQRFLSGHLPRYLAASAGDGTLADVFARVAGSLGVAVEPSRGAPHASLAALARRAGIGTRQVLLRDQWWRNGNGPLLAFRRNEGARVDVPDDRTSDELVGAPLRSPPSEPVGEPAAEPVALLVDARGRYQLFDAAKGRGVIVDAELAAQFASHATQFYRPLPAALTRLRDLLAFAGPFADQGAMRDTRALLTMAALAALLGSAVPITTGVLFESIIPRAEYSRLPALVLGLCVCAASAAVFDLVKAVALLRLEGRMDFLLQPALIQRLLELPVRFFRDYGAGDLNDRVLGVQRIRRLLTEASAVSLLAMAFSVVSIGVVLCYSPALALLAIALGVGVFAIGGVAAYLQLRQEKVANDLRGREDSLALQMIQGIAKLRVTASEPRLFARWSALFAAHKTYAFRAQRFANLRQLLFNTLPLLAAIALFATTAKLRGPATLLADTPLSLGDFLAVNAAFGQFIGALSAATNATSGALTAIALFARLRPIVAAQPEQRAGKHDLGPSLGLIELSHVSFRYGVDTPWVLNDVSLRITPGQFVAVVGASGSGKSTLLRLLLGFETAQQGDVLFADRSINTLDTAALRRHVGVVLQNGKIATGSVFENIVCGLDFSLDDAWDAARMAGLDTEIRSLPMGMHTMLVEGNATLSGGQYQRLMIARALIGKPQLVIFDEATSALDNYSQAIVAASLQRLRATRIVIAHRLSTVRDADCIFVLEAGRLVEFGSYDDLMAQRGAFHALAQRQLL